MLYERTNSVPDRIGVDGRDGWMGWIVTAKMDLLNGTDNLGAEGGSSREVA
jgi:hypothetical protein